MFGSAWLGFGFSFGLVSVCFGLVSVWFGFGSVLFLVLQQQINNYVSVSVSVTISVLVSVSVWFRFRFGSVCLWFGFVCFGVRGSDGCGWLRVARTRDPPPTTHTPRPYFVAMVGVWLVAGRVRV